MKRTNTITLKPDIECQKGVIVTFLRSLGGDDLMMESDATEDDT